ncbi:MAG TPA: MATE family efflux transporter, partial [Microscillaceae bacterium]|nr:MATE family efflux transporter [Microscillaceae bacterium]
WRIYKQEFTQMFRLSLPIVAAQVGIVLLGVTDNMMVGYLGATELAAAGIANSIFFVISIVGLGLTSVISPMSAAAKARQDHTQLRHLLLNVVRASVLCGLFTVGLVYLTAYFFEVFRQPADVAVLAKPYLIVIGWSALPLIVFAGLRSFIEGLSIIRPGMYISYLAVVINVFLNWVLIFGHWGFPAWGLWGAGVATLLSRIFIALLFWGFILRSSRIKPYAQQWQIWKDDTTQLVQIFKLGIPAGMQYFFEVAAFSSAAVLAGWLGKVSLAAHQIAISLASVTYMMAAGFGSAGAIRVGAAFGHRHRLKILRAANTAYWGVVAFMSFTCVIFIVFGDQLVWLYIQDAEVIALAAPLMIIAAFFQLSDGVQVVGLGVLRGIADLKVPTFFTLIAYWVVGLPLGYWLGFYTPLGVNGIWIGLSVGLTVSAALLTNRFYKLLRLMKKETLRPRTEKPAATTVA